MMARYKITIIQTDIYDVEITADSLELAESMAEGSNPDDWKLDEVSSYTTLGTDHKIYNILTNRWEQING